VTLTGVIATAVEALSESLPFVRSLRDSCLVVIPALNEEATIAGVVRKLRQLGFERIRVIDNGSSDATAQRGTAQRAAVRIWTGLLAWIVEHPTRGRVDSLLRR
jgi:hypothetical protein